jgi:hypothetical protein
LAKILRQWYFGRGDVGEVIKDGGEAPHAVELGEGNAGADTKGIHGAPFWQRCQRKWCWCIDVEGVGEVPSYQRTEKSCENAPELIGCIF